MPSREEILNAVKEHGTKTAAAEALGLSRWRVWEACKNRRIEDETELHRRLRQAEQKINKLKGDLKAEEARREIAESDLQRAIALNDLIQDLDSNDLYYRPITPERLSKSQTKSGCTAVICATDWHLEKNIEPSTVSGINEFNLDIAQERIDRFWRKSLYLIELWSHIAKVDNVVLWLGGDLINNYLHEEDVEGNFLGPTEAVLCMEEHLATGIELLSDKAPLSQIICNYGNHARTTHRNRPATGWKTSWEYLAYRHLAARYSDFDWQITKGYMNYQPIQGQVCRFHHGESVRYNGGVGGLTIPMNKAVAQWDKGRHADLTFNGHFHQYLPHGFNWVSCGCLCGYDAFAQSIKAEPQPPTQTVAFVDKHRGLVGVLPIFVEAV
jgi:hypothetical protein